MATLEAENSMRGMTMNKPRKTILRSEPTVTQASSTIAPQEPADISMLEHKEVVKLVQANRRLHLSQHGRAGNMEDYIKGVQDFTELQLLQDESDPDTFFTKLETTPDEVTIRPVNKNKKSIGNFLLVSKDATISQSWLLHGVFWGIAGNLQFYSRGSENPVDFIVSPTVTASERKEWEMGLEEINARNERLGLTHPEQRVCPICGRRFFPRRPDQQYDRTQCANASANRQLRARKSATNK